MFKDLSNQELFMLLSPSRQRELEVELFDGFDEDDHMALMRDTMHGEMSYEWRAKLSARWSALLESTFAFGSTDWDAARQEYENTTPPLATSR